MFLGPDQAKSQKNPRERSCDVGGDGWRSNSKNILSNPMWGFQSSSCEEEEKPSRNSRHEREKKIRSSSPFSYHRSSQSKAFLILLLVASFYRYMHVSSFLFLKPRFHVKFVACGVADPDAEVIALSPKTLMATNRFLCEICGKGFQRDQNLQLHRRGHNLPWKLRQRSTKESRKRVYVCPEKSCVHHHPSRALGDLTGIKKHFCRKHGEKKWKCEKCSKRYAVQSDWKAHSKTCGTREYRCDCGTLFSRRDSFITHRAFCDALAEETARITAASNLNNAMNAGNINYHLMGSSIRPNMGQHLPSIFKPISSNNQAIEQIRGGLSLWMGQGPQDTETLNQNLSDLHQMGSTNTGSLYIDPFASCSNPQQTDYQLNWVYGSKHSSSNSGELTSASLTTGSMKESGSPHHVSAPSLYSTQHHHPHPTPTNMSATALLQKAAQIGVTSSDPSFLGSYGMKCSNIQIQGGTKYNGLLGPVQIGPNFSSDLDNSLNDLSASSHSQMYPSKRQNTRRDDQDGGQTRDFLGVGFQTLCPSSINGWI